MVVHVASTKCSISSYDGVAVNFNLFCNVANVVDDFASLEVKNDSAKLFTFNARIVQS